MNIAPKLRSPRTFAETRISSGTFTTNPTSTGTGLAIGNAAAASANNSIVLGNSSSVTNTTSIAIGYSKTCTGYSSISIGDTGTCAGVSSVAIGNGTTCAGDYSISIGYNASNSTNKGIAIGNTTYAGGSNSVAIGFNCDATGSNSISIGSFGSGNHSGLGSGSIGLGWQHNSGAAAHANSFLVNASNSALGPGSTSLNESCYVVLRAGPIDTSAASKNTVSIGNGITPRLFGQVLFRGCRGFENGTNDSTYSWFETRTKTTDATQTRMWLNYTDYVTGTISAVIQANSANYFKATLIAKSSTDWKSWVIEGMITQGASASTTAFVGTPSNTVIANSSGASAWTISPEANTSTGALGFLVTGAAATTIHWFGKIDLMEIL